MEKVSFENLFEETFGENYSWMNQEGRNERFPEVTIDCANLPPMMSANSLLQTK